MDLEQQTQDPDDVFFSARDRKNEIKQQIQKLETALKRGTSRSIAKKYSSGQEIKKSVISRRI
jgi:hypothetical protein